MGIKSIKQQGLGGLEVTLLKSQGNLATGGSIANLNGYRIHIFNSTATFNALLPLNVEYLIVAGGGSAGSPQYHSGGGGAGGVLQGSCLVNAGTYTVTVGSGGSNPGGSNTKGNNGSNSSFNGLTALGGGGAGVYSNQTGLSGGSGGGGGAQGGIVGTAGTGTSGQGYNGGSFDGTSSNKHGGGGGGAGGAGTTGGVSTGGNGGIGILSSISGILNYYGGGGGGSTETLGETTTGGLGGGGNGNHNTGENGTANTGGGGGGGERVAPATSGSGGSGIIIIRYKINSNTPTLSTPIITNGLVYSVVGDNVASYTTKANIVGAKIYSTFGNVASSTRSANYTVQYSDDNSSWTTAFTGVMSNNGNCGIQLGSGTGSGSYGYRRYWRYVEGSAVVSHHPRCSRIMLTDINGIDYVIVKYVDDNKADSGTYQPGTVTVDLASRWHDLSISSNSVGLSNNPTYNSNYGGYFSFNGTTQTIPIGSILNAYPFTVSFWASYPYSGWAPPSDGMDELMNMSISGQRISIGTIKNTGWPTGPTLMYGGSNHYSFDGSSALSTANQFYNVVWAVTGSNDSNHKIYVNGVSQTLTNNGGAHGGTAGWQIASNGNDGEYWIGSIASVQVYNKTLSQVEVNQNFNALRGKFGI